MSRDITETNAKAAFSRDELDMHFSQKHKLLDIWMDLSSFLPPFRCGLKRRAFGSEEASRDCGGREKWRAVAWKQGRGRVQPSLNDPILGAIRA